MQVIAWSSGSILGVYTRDVMHVFYDVAVPSPDAVEGVVRLALGLVLAAATALVESVESSRAALASSSAVVCAK